MKRKSKAGASKVEVKTLTKHREKFAQGVAGGLNQSEAYRLAYPKSLKWKDNAVHREASMMAAIPMVSQRITELAKEYADRVGLTIEKTLREVARLSYSDVRKFFKVDGTVIPLRELDDDVAASIASIEVEEIKAEGAVIGVIRKLKLWDKNAALEKAMKHLGLYERDNSQGAEAIAKLFVYVPEKNARRVAKAT